MKLYIKFLLIFGFASMVAEGITAQPFKTLYTFSLDADGGYPAGGLILSSNTLYGTAGNVFKINTDGTGFYPVHTFTGNDGSLPEGNLILSNNTLYGTTVFGGVSNSGAVFAVNTDGSGSITLHSFTEPVGPEPQTNNDGAEPYGGLAISGNTVFGTAYRGGSFGYGTLFAVNTDGTGFTNLHNFAGGTEGGYPHAGLIISGNRLYGTTYVDFNSRTFKGTVFAVNLDGSGFTTLHNFTGGTDGESPRAGVIISGNTLYGTASQGGSTGYGTVFALNTNGSDFTNLHSFTAPYIFYPYGNSDGAVPESGLILSDGILYGTASEGGSEGQGTVFAVKTNGTGFKNLHSFHIVSNSYPNTNSGGSLPFGGLAYSDLTLYGTAYQGGSSGYGTVFSLSLLPQLVMIRSSTDVVLSWPTNTESYSNSFILQFTTNLISTNVWSTVSPAPTVVNGQNTVTNPVSGTQKFYRLSQ